MRRRFRRSVLAAVAAAAVASTSCSTALAAAADEAAITAAFLFNFMRFVEWPSASLPPNAPIVACVINDSAVAFSLSGATRGRLIGDHRVVVREPLPDASLRSCHLVYIGSRHAAHIPMALAELKAAPVLSVSSSAGFAEAGGVAELSLVNQKMRFTLNSVTAARAQLRLSSKLLGLATVKRQGAARD